MRKIEKQMLQAIADGRDWQSGNTAVCCSQVGLCVVLLHGNTIAAGHLGESLQIDLETFHRWPTMTTRSRLHALGLSYPKTPLPR